MSNYLTIITNYPTLTVEKKIGSQKDLKSQSYTSVTSNWEDYN